MRMSRRGFVFAAASLAALPSWGRQWKDDRGYSILTTPLAPSTQGGKRDLLEFFWYGCPHCNELDGKLAQWVEARAEKFNLQRSPALLGRGWTPLAKAFFAMSAVGGFDARLHGLQKVFRFG